MELSKELGLKRGVRAPGVYKAGDIYMRDPFLFTDTKRTLFSFLERIWESVTALPM